MENKFKNCKDIEAYQKMWLEIIESYDINLAAFIDVIKPELNDINNKNGTKSINYIELQENNEVKKV